MWFLSFIRDTLPPPLPHAQPLALQHLRYSVRMPTRSKPPPLSAELAAAAQTVQTALHDVDIARQHRDNVVRASRKRGGKNSAIAEIVGLGHQMISKICAESD